MAGPDNSPKGTPHKPAYRSALTSCVETLGNASVSADGSLVARQHSVTGLNVIDTVAILGAKPSSTLTITTTQATRRPRGLITDDSRATVKVDTATNSKAIGSAPVVGIPISEGGSPAKVQVARDAAGATAKKLQACMVKVGL